MDCERIEVDLLKADYAVALIYLSKCKYDKASLYKNPEIGRASSPGYMCAINFKTRVGPNGYT